MDQMLNQRENNACSFKEKKTKDETMKGKRIQKEERLRLMEEKKRLKEVSHCT